MPHKAIFVWHRLFCMTQGQGNRLVVIIAHMRYNAPHSHTAQPEENGCLYLFSMHSPLCLLSLIYLVLIAQLK
jgi:hypothetical protein